MRMVITNALYFHEKLLCVSEEAVMWCERIDGNRGDRREGQKTDRKEMKCKQV